MKHFLVATFLFISAVASSQIGLGTNSPNASAALDITATGKGLLIPRMTSLQRNSISATFTPTQALAAEGLEVYDLTLHGKYYWDGTKWVSSIANPKVAFKKLTYSTYYEVANTTYTDIPGFSETITVTAAPVTLFASAIVLAHFNTAPFPCYFRMIINGGEYTNYILDAVASEGLATYSILVPTPMQGIVTLAQNTTYTIKIMAGKSQIGDVVRINASDDLPTSSSTFYNSSLILKTD